MLISHCVRVAVKVAGFPSNCGANEAYSHSHNDWIHHDTLAQMGIHGQRRRFHWHIPNSEAYHVRLIAERLALLAYILGGISIINLTCEQHVSKGPLPV
jgi:hypothetical protein